MINKKSRNITKYLPYILLAPTMIFYILFWFRPVLTAFIEAFTDLDGGFTFQNIVVMFSEQQFAVSLKNTILFAVISVVIQFILAFALALLLNKKFKGSSLLLFIALIPMAIPPTAVAILWNTGFQTLGWVNSLLMNFNLIAEPISWLSARGIEGLLFLIAVDTWTVLPSVMIIILAGLQNMNKELEEAGKVFGATRFQIVKDIVYPILKPSIATALILRLISSLQVWQLAVMLFGYGRVPFLVERVAYYNEMVPGLESSSKMAVTYSLFVTFIVLIFTFVYLKINKNSMKGVE